jgi:hypothetical protein
MKKPTLKIAACAVLVMVLPTCNQVIMTAPSGSTISLFANPTIISAQGGVSVISALIIVETGAVVADGTVVQFFTDLGTIDEQGKTNDGVARVNLRANGLSGVANISAFSGGSATPAASASPSPPPTGTGAPQSGTLQVTIGNVAASSLNVTADPTRITVSRSSHITANVFDKNGNTITGVPVFFDVTTGAASNFMDSQGAPVFTDSNGQAMDVLRTKQTTSGTVTVRAQVPGGTAGTLLSATVDVQVVLD